MATFLDITLLDGAKVIFTFLLVYIIVWGLLVMSKPFGKDMKTGPYAIIAVIAAFLTVLSRTMRFLVEWITPWMLFLVIFLFFILFILRMFNVSDTDIRGIIANPTVYTIVIILIAIVVMLGFGQAFGQASLEATQGPGMAVDPATGQPMPGTPGATDTGNFALNLMNTMLHPKIIAIIAVILIATVTVWLMGRPDFV